jgi:hypothetical protein
LVSQVRLQALKPNHSIAITGRKCPIFTMIAAHIRPTSPGRGGAMTDQLHKTTEEEYAAQVRNLVRVVSACTLGLWSFAAGLLIGSFYLF